MFKKDQNPFEAWIPYSSIFDPTKAFDRFAGDLKLKPTGTKKALREAEARFYHFDEQTQGEIILRLLSVANSVLSEGACGASNIDPAEHLELAQELGLIKLGFCHDNKACLTEVFGYSQELTDSTVVDPCQLIAVQNAEDPDEFIIPTSWAINLLAGRPLLPLTSLAMANSQGKDFSHGVVTKENNVEGYPPFVLRSSFCGLEVVESLPSRDPRSKIGLESPLIQELSVFKIIQGECSTVLRYPSSVETVITEQLKKLNPGSDGSSN